MKRPMSPASDFANLEAGVEDPPPQGTTSFIIEPRTARPILLASQLMLITIVHALLREAYGAAVMGTALYSTSVNFWRSPTKGWRRNLDYSCVALSFIYFTSLAVRVGGHYTTIWFIGIGVIALIFLANETRFWCNNNKL